MPTETADKQSRFTVRSIWCWISQRMMYFALLVMVIGLVAAYFWPLMVVTIPAGYRGVRWHRFGVGTDLKASLSEGTRLKFPWDEIYRYDARLQVVSGSYDVITKDGLSIKATISFRYRINPKFVGTLHQSIGPGYVNVLLIPEIGSSARVLIARYTAEDFYTNYRLQVQGEILSQLRKRLLDETIYSLASGPLVEIDDVMINNLTLPKSVQSAISRKVEAYQRSLEYDFLLASEKKEAERREIEGKGIRGMFDILGNNNLDSYLRLASINATLALAKSANAKVVVAGNAAVGGWPILLGNQLNESTNASTDTNKAGEIMKKEQTLVKPTPATPSSVPASSASAP